MAAATKQQQRENRIAAAQQYSRSKAAFDSLIAGIMDDAQPETSPTYTSPHVMEIKYNALVRKITDWRKTGKIHPSLIDWQTYDDHANYTPPSDDTDWKHKTSPPNRSPVFLDDARCPLITAWVNQRVLETSPAIDYKIARLSYLDRLYDLTEDDARQQAVINVYDKINGLAAQGTPQWALEDNGLIAHDASQRIRIYQSRARQTAGQWETTSIDKMMETEQPITAIDKISFAVMRSQLAYYRGDKVIQQSAITDAIDTLTDPQRICFTLAKFWGIPTKEIVTMTEMPQSTVLSHVRRARKSLKSQLADMNPNGISPQCPQCGSKNLRALDKTGKSITNEKTSPAHYTCNVCKMRNAAKIFETRPTDPARSYYVGRNQPLDTGKRETVLARALPIGLAGLVPEPTMLPSLAPNIPTEYPHKTLDLAGWSRPEKQPTPARPPAPKNIPAPQYNPEIDGPSARTR